jgi:hypothetical protein
VTTVDEDVPAEVPDERATIAFHPSEEGVTYECKIDSQWVSNCASPLTVGPLKNGQHHLEIRAVDAVGNREAAPVTRDFTIAYPAPETSIDATDGFASKEMEVKVKASTNSPDVTFDCRLDGGPAEPCGYAGTQAGAGQYTGTIRVTPPTQGPHTLTVAARHRSGSVDPTPAVIHFTQDRVPPVVTITKAPPDPYSGLHASIEFTVDDPEATLSCTVWTNWSSGPSESYEPCSSSVELDLKRRSTYMVVIGAVDRAGNAYYAHRSFRATLADDKQPPETTITSQPEGTVYSGPAKLEFESEEGATFTCEVDGGGFQACTSPWTFPGADGAHEVRVRATDPAGNVDPTPATARFTVERDKPVARASWASGSGSLSGPNPEIALTSNHADSTFACSWDLAVWEPCTTPYRPGPLPSGARRLYLRATDALGRTSSTSTFSFTVDATPPQTSLSPWSLPETVDTARPKVDFGTDEAAHTECRVDDGSWSSCTTPVTLGPLADGQHEMQLRSTDRFGNVEDPPFSRTFTVDTSDRTPPDTWMNWAPDVVVHGETAQFSFSASDQDATFECRLDGGAFEPCNGAAGVHRADTAPLEPGTHLFEVRALDRSGNTDATPASAEFVVAEAPPEQSLDPPSDPPAATQPPRSHQPETLVFTAPPKRTRDRTPVVVFAGTPDAVTFLCSLDRNPAEGCSSPYVAPRLARGRHRLVIRAVAADGTVEATPEILRFRIKRKHR